MASSSPVHSSPGDHPDEDDSTVVPDSHDNPQDEADTGDAVGDPSSAQDPQNAKQGLPIQKRRRVTRACDECRRKKIKCDGKQPCTHCTVYSYGKSLWSFGHRSKTWVSIADRPPTDSLFDCRMHIRSTIKSSS